MRGSRAVQVVLGEGEPGVLRFVLEAEGFQVVGQARGDTELKRVLDATHPSVIVLDAGISASAAVDARSRSIGAQIVVVWPDGVRASIADDRVDPATVFQDLGAAVRRAAERVRVSSEDLVVLPESPAIDPVALDEPHLMLVPDIGDEPKQRNRRRVRQALTVAAAWTLALTASAAIGLTLPRTFGLFEPSATPRPTVTSPGAQPKDEQASAPTDGSGAPEPEPKSCDPKRQTNGPSSGTGRPDDPGRGCGQGRGNATGQPDDPGKQGNGGGPPEDPGSANGNGGGADGPDSDGNAQNPGSVGNGQNGGVHGNGGDGGSKVTSTSSAATEGQDGPGKGNDRAGGPG